MPEDQIEGDFHRVLGMTDPHEIDIFGTPIGVKNQTHQGAPCQHPVSADFVDEICEEFFKGLFIHGFFPCKGSACLASIELRMIEEVKRAVAVLEAWRSGGCASVDRPEVVAHATLGAWISHWPGRSTSVERDLLAQTVAIRAAEPGRWIKQRRIALTKLSRAVRAMEAEFLR
jgi:hypothetical protein